METPYPYQLRAYEAIQRGRSIIIQAPTGAGKTRAALYPYFANLDRAERITDTQSPDWANLPLPLTCRYAVPMRVLATQFQREYQNHFSRLDQRSGSRFNDTYTRLDVTLPAIQTGESPDDTLFEAPLTFCTIDQLLASFIGTPYSVSPRLANLNVGAVVGSYLILDEFHLYPVEHGNGARLTALAMLRMLHDFSPFVLMTATLSTPFVTALANLLNTDVIQIGDEELQTIQAGRSRHLLRSQQLMTAESILNHHATAYKQDMGASLIVCNTVARAQDIYLELRQAIADMRGIPAPDLMLLHSRFTTEDRRSKSAQLEEQMGKDAWKGDIHPNVIVVATQVVEVGLNISAGVLHTELAPANALIQRFGRCARFARQRGDVIVYPVPAADTGKVSYLPYDESLALATWNYLESLLPDRSSRIPFGFADEQKLIDVVHAAEDQRMLDRFSESEANLRRTIMETLSTHQPGKRSQLIRDVDTVSVLIHPEPENAITTNPFGWTAFSLRPGTLQSAWNDLLTRQAETDAPFVMKQLLPASAQENGTEDDIRREPVYTWDVIHHPGQIRGALRINLPPQLATYDSELGFRLLIHPDDTSNGWKSTLENRRRDKRLNVKRAQRSYVEHIAGLMRAYDWSVRRELAWLAARLQNTLSLPVGALDSAIRFAIAFHDLGKLCVGWQQWAHEYQRQLAAQHGARFNIPPARRYLAKTDMLGNWQDDRAFRARLTIKRPPSHACAGAIATPALFSQYLLAAFGTDNFDALTASQRNGGKALLKATLSAIARHHTPAATTYDPLAWDAGVHEPIAAALTVCRIAADMTQFELHELPSGEIPEEFLALPEHDGELSTWLAFALVRALRLCDQRAERDL